MAESFRFFDSVEGQDDRYYTADEFAEYFRQFIRNGIFSGGLYLQVQVDGTDMKSSIREGLAWIEGYLYKIDAEPLQLQHEVADSTYNRIDRIVIRLDKTLENRCIKAFVKTGEPSANPQVPPLQRDENIYEIALAQVLVKADEATLKPENVSDERLNKEVCGLVTHLFEQIDTAAIFGEWITYLNTKKMEGNTALQNWQGYLLTKENGVNTEYNSFLDQLSSKLASYKSTWDAWVVSKISEPNGAFYAEWKTWFQGIQDITNFVTKPEFNQHAARHQKGGADEISLENLEGKSKELKSHLAESIIHNAAGTANNIAITTGGDFKYLQGNQLRFKATASSTGNITINADAKGAKPGKKSDGTNISNLKENKVYSWYYDVVGDCFFLADNADINVVSENFTTQTTLELDASDIRFSGTKKADALCWSSQCIWRNVSTNAAGELTSITINNLRLGNYAMILRLKSANNALTTNAIKVDVLKNTGGSFINIATKSFKSNEFPNTSEYHQFYVRFHYTGTKATSNELKIVLTMQQQASAYEIALDSIVIQPVGIGVLLGV